MSDLQAIKKRTDAIRAEMKKYPGAALMAVVKTRSAEEIEYATGVCGVTLAGENRVQEFLAHEEHYGNAKVHFIGTLQKNKVKYLIGKIDMIESVDSVGLAEEISKRSVAAGTVTEIMIEVNTGREPQKSGVMPEELGDLLDTVTGLEGIRLRGLMTVSPVTDDADARRGYFAMLRRLRDENVKYFAGRGLLSMGMSDSYREALEEGADIVRIGTGIFGPRQKKAQDAEK